MGEQIDFLRRQSFGLQVSLLLAHMQQFRMALAALIDQRQEPGVSVQKQELAGRQQQSLVVVRAMNVNEELAEFFEKADCDRRAVDKGAAARFSDDATE